MLNEIEMKDIYNDSTDDLQLCVTKKLRCNNTKLSTALTPTSVDGAIIDNNVNSNTNNNVISFSKLTYFIKQTFDKDVVFYLHKLILHVCIHLSLLSILEPVFFFEYAIKVEKDLFYDQLASFTKYQQGLFESSDSQNIRNQDFYQAFIEFLNYENISIDSSYNNMKNNAIVSKNENDKYNDKLEYLGYQFPIIMTSCSLFYYFCIQYLYNYKNFAIQVFGEHLFLMIFVAFYEFWFFTNIILNYHPFTTDEVMFFLMNCFYKRLFTYYPELSTIQNNVQVQCKPL